MTKMREGDLISLVEFYLDYHIHDADGPHNSTDKSGEHYTIVVAGGVKSEGEDYPCIYKSESEAIRAYFKTLVEWLKGRQIIIWRQRPELVVFTFKGKEVAWERRYQIYSRLTAY